MRRHLVLFVRAPQLGGGKRRLAREIGDVATVRFERLMIALLLRRLARDSRWRLRLAPRLWLPPFAGGSCIAEITSKLVLRPGMCNEREPDGRVLSYLSHHGTETALAYE